MSTNSLGNVLPTDFFSQTFRTSGFVKTPSQGKMFTNGSGKPLNFFKNELGSFFFLQTHPHVAPKHNWGKTFHRESARPNEKSTHLYPSKWDLSSCQLFRLKIVETTATTTFFSFLLLLNMEMMNKKIQVQPGKNSIFNWGPWNSGRTWVPPRIARNRSPPSINEFTAPDLGERSVGCLENTSKTMSK